MIPSSLRWRCRRGLLELDLALGRFLEEGYERLAPRERALFEDLLTENDADLWAWMQGETAPARFAALLESFRLGTHHQIDGSP